MSASDPIPEKRYTVRLIGLKEGTPLKEVLDVLAKLYKTKTDAELSKALASLPITLTRSATEQAARKIRMMLESKGAILEILTTGTPKATVPASEEAEKGPPMPRGQAPPANGFVERRTKPSVSSGLALSSMSIGEILDRAFRLLKENFTVFCVVVALPLFLVFILSLLGQWIGLGAFHVVGGPSPQMVGSFGFLIFLLFMLCFIWAMGALNYAVSERYLGHHITVGGAYGYAFSVWNKNCWR